MKKYFYVIAIIATVILSALTINVNAADYTFSASMKPSSTTIEAGEEFTVNIKVSNINVGNNGINSINGVFEYDASAFEDVTADSFEGLNDWTVKYTANTGKLSFLKTNFVKESQDICQVTLKAKSDVNVSKGAIELKDLVASNSENSIASSTTEVSLEIGIGEGSPSNSNSIKINANTNSSSNRNTNTNTNVTNIINNNTNNNTNRNNTNTNSLSNDVNQENVEENESEEEEMPDTGLDDSIVKAILLVGIIGIFGYIKFRSLDRKDK